jgi:hypothetical protein
MRSSRGALHLAMMLYGCQATPVSGWGIDTWTLTVGPDSQIQGQVRWDIYARSWDRRQSDQQLVCTALLDVVLFPAPGCERCVQAWGIEATPRASNCAGDVPAPPDTLHIGLGEVGENLQSDPERDSIEVGSWVQYLPDGPWLEHGWGLPAPGSTEQTVTLPWTGTPNLVIQPAWAYGIP